VFEIDDGNRAFIVPLLWSGPASSIELDLRPILDYFCDSLRTLVRPLSGAPNCRVGSKVDVGDMSSVSQCQYSSRED
jgi:hypothetical protein